jgi:hypothetical protein
VLAAEYDLGVVITTSFVRAISTFDASEQVCKLETSTAALCDRHRCVGSVIAEYRFDDLAERSFPCQVSVHPVGLNQSVRY